MSAPKRQLPHITEMQTSTLGDPPALPGRQQKFDNPSGMLLVSKCQLSACCLELVVLTLGRDKAPLRGPRPLKPPALPEDAYWGVEIHATEFHKLISFDGIRKQHSKL